MTKLTHRERVALALAHQEADRVPIDLMGNASCILDGAYFKLRDYLGLDDSIKPFREGSTANYYDPRILEIFDVDFHRVFLHTTPAASFRKNPDGTETDIWGITWNKSGIYVNAEINPLRDLDIDGVADYNWPDPERMWYTEGLAEEARYLYENTDYALVARNPVSPGFLDRGCVMRGMDQFMMDMAINPELAKLIIDKTLEIHLGMWDMFLQAVGPYVVMVETADDLGGQENPLISPRMYRKFIKPAQQKVNELIKDRAPQARIFMHNDGAIVKLIPDLIDAGVEILNPVQPSAGGMDSAFLKETFGEQLVFHGAVDQKPVEGSEEELRAEVRRRIDALAPGGGYILATSNVIVDPPTSNIAAIFDEARSYGRYPIGGK
ncbi:MAG: hypothetical protein K8R77_12445 [Anaerolineaceae bacterium]|nr:hypothetical protein [Anaerolineaceae bacterium]